MAEESGAPEKASRSTAKRGVRLPGFCAACSLGSLRAAGASSETSKLFLKLSITIPALNEEEAIRSIIERSLEARAHIVAQSPASDVAITVVSDGSTDRTVEIAKEYADRIHLIVFPENRGYGAAISEGWRQSDAEWLGFLDADGTCDPRFFADLCVELERSGADIVLGCRLNPGSRMPALRKLGNRLFAAMLSALSLARVRDVASGMRVVRRDCLPTLMPLPATLDFTPAMSTRAILSPELSIAEIDMPYHERAGRSKLHPVRDGLRFLSVILKTTFVYRPSRPLVFAALGLVLLTVVMMIQPVWHYARERRVEEWMVYRFLVAVLFSSTAVLMLCVAHLGRKAADISLSDEPAGVKYEGKTGQVFRHGWFWAIPAVLATVAGVLVWDAWREFVTLGQVTEHWSRFVVMMFLLTVSAILVATKFLDYCLNLLADRLHYLRHRR